MNTCIRANTNSRAGPPPQKDPYAKSKLAFSIVHRSSSSSSCQVPSRKGNTEVLASSLHQQTEDCHKLRLTDGRTLYATRGLHTIPEDEDGVIHTILTVSTRHCRRNAVSDFGDFFEGLWDRLAEQHSTLPDENNKPPQTRHRARRCDAWDDMQFKEHFQTISTCF